MKPPKPSITQESLLKDAANRILSALRAQSEAKVETVPAGWFTSAQLAAQVGVTANTMNKNLRGLVAARVYETRMIKVKSGSRIFGIPHYKEAASKH